MIIRITAKLGKKIGFTPSQILPLDDNPFTDWTADLFRADRTQYIILTNTVSLYSIVLYGRGITDDSIFLQRAISNLIENLGYDGFGFIAERIIAQNTFKISFSKSLNRAVTGSMNELIFQAKYYLEDEDTSPFSLCQKLNNVPLSYIDYKSPKEAFSKLKIA
jgi:hypothetical protein